MSAREPFTVSGPLEEDHPVPNVGAGISCAQTFANHRRRELGEFSYYVRDRDLVCFAIVTKLESGVIETDVTVSGRLEQSRADESTTAGIEAALELEAAGRLMFVEVS